MQFTPLTPVHCGNWGWSRSVIMSGKWTHILLGDDSLESACWSSQYLACLPCSIRCSRPICSLLIWSWGFSFSLQLTQPAQFNWLWKTKLQKKKKAERKTASFVTYDKTCGSFDTRFSNYPIWFVFISKVKQMPLQLHWVINSMRCCSYVAGQHNSTSK